jgi:hypothetical protein
VDASFVVLPPPEVELSAEVAEGAEVHPPHELLGEDPVESLEFPASSRVVWPPVDHSDALALEVLPKLPRDEATPVVDVEGLGLSAAFERLPKVVRGLPRPLSEVGSGHHEVSGAIVQDGVRVDMPPDPGDAELVDIRLQEGVHVAPLESLERERLPNDRDHEPVTLQDPMDGPPTHLDPPTGEEGVDPHRAPRRVFPPQLKDAINEVPVDPVRAVVGSSGLVAQPLDVFLPIVSAPTT